MTTKPHQYKKGDRVRNIHTGEIFTVIRSYWQNYAGGNTSDYTVLFEATDTQPTPWDKSTNLEPYPRQITIDTDERFAPGCFILCLVNANGEWDTRDEDRTKLLQRDTDLPSVARNFGMTDEEPTPNEACEYLYSEAPGTIIEDPGYFAE